MADSLESYFGLSADELFRAILGNPRCLMNVKGAVAEEHLRLQIEALIEKGIISSYTRGGEGQPDFFLNYQDRRLILECKLVQKAKNEANRRALVEVTIDFKKTRNQQGGPHLRFYRKEEFDIVGACLFNRTGEWHFVYALTSTFTPHPVHQDRLTDKLVVMRSGELLPNWTEDLERLLKAM